MIDKIEESHSHKSGKSAPKQKRVGLSISRHFASPDKEPFDEIEWERRTAEITDEKGKSIFQQKDVEVPKAWSMMATKVVVQKYFRGAMDTPEREYSVKQLINRVADTIATWGMDQGYFQDDMSCKAFVDDLKFLLVNQHMAFNSPVWFNLGIEKFPQVSACFINSVDDSMDSILGLAKTEGMLFKYGSGTGTNFSTLRSSKELLNGGGTSSGPISFMKGFDAFAGVIKSGGKTRRAAKMVILNAEHPDIVDFINCKVKEEKKAWALIDAGYDGSFTGEAYGSVFFQNSNNSVRVTDEFMEAVQDDGDWVTKAVRDGRPTETFKAKDLWHQIADAAWQCGDPGLQYDTTINTWHTSPNTARINASNPCSEYMYLDDSACNLASLNLRKFQKLDGSFDVERFEHAVDVTILAQEIMVDKARYPTAKIEENSHRFRPLGLGYANLGALLMSRGLPYDSDAGRAYAGAVTALMHGRANRMSAKISGEATGPFSGYEENKDPFMMVMRMHQKALGQIDSALAPVDILNAASDAWHDVVSLGPVHGFRNGQVTVLAPTGTIGFMMDCDTTGVEPDIALVKYKRLVGGGLLKIVNQTVPEALNCLGYSAAEKDLILRHIDAYHQAGAPRGLRLRFQGNER
jgi:ribonucleoside-diphosphate reductase alpha chain